MAIERSRQARLPARCAAILSIALVTMMCGFRGAGAQAIEGFAWVDLHGEPSEVTDRVRAVIRALAGEKYTALREIAVVGDEALVITASRPNPAAMPAQDRYTVYSVGLKEANETPTLLIKGTNLQIRDWLRFIRDGETELVATYDDCSDCRATTFLTAFYLDAKSRKWRARWPRDVSGAPLSSASRGDAGETDQAYALLVNTDGRAVLATWTHFHPKMKGKGADYLFEYDVDPATGLERSRLVTGSEAEPLKKQLCGAEGGVLGLAAGQDSASCTVVLQGGSGRALRHSSRRRRVFTKPLEGESRPSNPH